MIGRFFRSAGPQVLIALVASAAMAAPSSAQSSAGRADTTTRAKVDTVWVNGDTARQTPGMQEFEARRKLGTGYYLTAKQIAAQRDRSFADIIVTRFPGLRVIGSGRLGVQYLASTRGEGVGALASTNGMVPCYVHVYVDGTYLNDSEISWINARDVAGVEFYDGTRTPAAYRRSGNGCGALLIWTNSSAAN
ncbi:MAG: TonB-dependent receptor plug domain-containing protein [Gemmatimonadaceae bacterium]